MVVTNDVPEHVRVRPGDPDTGLFGQPPDPAGGGVPVHPGAAATEQDRPAGTGADGAVDRPPDGGWQRDKDDFGALAADPQHPVAVLIAEVADVGSGGLEDAQSEQAEHGDLGEVVVVGRFAGGGEQGLELQVRETQGG
jgi:hypothetical protein